MANPKNCFGDVTVGAFGWAADALAVRMSSAAASAAARTRREYMNPPPGWRRIQYQIELMLYGDADRRRTRFRHHPVERAVVLIDRAVRVRAVEQRVAGRVERIGRQRVPR